MVGKILANGPHHINCAAIRYKNVCYTQEVEPMNKESDHIHITALTSALSVSIRVQYMDRGEGGKVNYHDFPDTGRADEPYLHLLYRPGHYDILYK